MGPWLHLRPGLRRAADALHRLHTCHLERKQVPSGGLGPGWCHSVLQPTACWHRHGELGLVTGRGSGTATPAPSPMRPHPGSVPGIRTVPPAQGTPARWETQALKVGCRCGRGKGAAGPVEGWDPRAARTQGSRSSAQPPDPSLLPSATAASGRLACGVFLPPLIKYLWGTLTCSRQDFSQPFLPRHVALPAARPLTPPPGLTLPERTDSPPSHFHKGTEQEVAQGWGRPQPPHRHRGPDQMLRRQQDVMTEKDEDRDKGFLLKRLKCGSPRCCK